MTVAVVGNQCDWMQQFKAAYLQVQRKKQSMVDYSLIMSLSVMYHFDFEKSGTFDRRGGLK